MAGREAPSSGWEKENLRPQEGSAFLPGVMLGCQDIQNPVWGCGGGDASVLCFHNLSWSSSVFFPRWGETYLVSEAESAELFPLSPSFFIPWSDQRITHSALPTKPLILQGWVQFWGKELPWPSLVTSWMNIMNPACQWIWATFSNTNLSRNVMFWSQNNLPPRTVF